MENINNNFKHHKIKVYYFINIYEKNQYFVKFHFKNKSSNN